MQHERFAPLVLPHTQAMARVAAALIGLADAEDAAQEALMRAWNNWTALREEGAVRSWLLRITVNVCHNWRAGHFGTHRSRTQPLGAETDEVTAWSLVGVGPGTTEHATALDLRLAVMSLPGELRAVVALRFYAGMDATEIGAALDLPSPTVRTRLRRALALLRADLAADHADQADQPNPTSPSLTPRFSTTNANIERR
jgi:RNA polymerase sigma-70 factor (ECF subfamily)